MTAGFRLLDSNDSEWDQLVSRTPHDVYHLSAYARLSETHEPCPVMLAVAQDGKDVLVLPVIIRPLSPDVPDGGGWCDVSGPYGYPVPVASTEDGAAVHRLTEVLWAGLREKDAVTAFLRWHPFLGIPHAALAPEAAFVRHGEHVVVRLEDLAPDPLVSLRHGHRTDIRSLVRSGFTLRIDDAADWTVFPELYRATMQRADARAYYFFPDAYFETLRQELDGQVRLVSVAAPDGSLAASGILFICGRIAQYHLSCVHEAYVASAPTKLAVLAMMKLAREAGATRLNLGSGLGGARDSLFEFKAGFSSERAPFETARVVLDAERYEALSRGIAAPGDFFPAYRYGHEPGEREEHAVSKELYRHKSQYHDITVCDEDGALALRFGGRRQSAVDAENLLDSGLLALDYLHLPLALNPTAKRALFIGLGGGVVPKRMWHDYPDMHIDVVELDPDVVDVARRFFGLPEDERLQVIVGDGRAYLADTAVEYDVIVVDAYFEATVPYALTTQEFVRLAAGHLAPGGVLAYNMAGVLRGRGSRTFHRFVKGISSALPAVYVFPEGVGVPARRGGSASRRQNIMVMAAEKPVPREELRRRIRGRVEGRVTVRGFDTFGRSLMDEPLPTRGVRPLTDAETPADGMLPA